VSRRDAGEKAPFPLSLALIATLSVIAWLVLIAIAALIWFVL
jgi:hypothetical protein